MLQWEERRAMLTCGKARLDWRIGRGDADREGGSGGRRGLGPGQGAVSREGDREAGSFHGGLVVSQLVNPLLLQQQGLLLARTKVKNKGWEFWKMFR